MQDLMAKLIAEVVAERERQTAMWGEPEHDNFVWLAILAEELGEVSGAALEGSSVNIRREIIHVAAVALAWLECIETRSGRG